MSSDAAVVDRIFAAAGEARAALENPSVPLSDWSADMDVTRSTTTGVRVGRGAALTYAAVWRAVNLLSDSVAKPRLIVYRQSDDGLTKVPDRDHYAYQLLRRKPNPYMSTFTWRQVSQGHVALDGNAYSYVLRDGAARPLEIWPLPPDRTYPVREIDQAINVTRLWYVTNLPNGSLRKLPAEDVIHVRGLGFDGLVGYSVLSVARESVGMGLAQRAHGTVFFKNNARPNVVLHPGKLGKEAREQLRSDWERLHSGIENAHRTAILQEGMKAAPMLVNARDSQLIESRQFEIREMANFFGVPPHKLGDTSRTAYNSLEQENQAFLDDSVEPKLCAWEDELFDKLLTEEQKNLNSHTVEFIRRDLVRANASARATFYHFGITDGWLTDDEVRNEEGYNPLTPEQRQQLKDSRPAKSLNPLATMGEDKPPQGKEQDDAGQD